MNGNGEGASVSVSVPAATPRLCGLRVAILSRSPDQSRYVSIGVMQPDGKAERILANGFSGQGPAWAPNGRVLMFSARNAAGGSASTADSSIDLTGHNERQIATPLGASDPAWSPLVK